jgi:hypothetical protein
VQAFDLWVWVARQELACQFPIPGGIYLFERRSLQSQGSWFGQPARRPESADKRRRLPVQPSKEPQFLKNQSPGKKRKAAEDQEYGAGDPARLRE